MILNTLLELYINSFSNESSNQASNFQQKNKSTKIEVSKTEKAISLQEKRALEFLTQNHSLFDMNLALVI